MADVIAQTHERPPAPSSRPPMQSVAPAPAVPRLSILIVTWNSERWIERCLASLPAACEGLDYEVLIHDNASSDATLERMPSPNTHVVKGAANDGFAAGTNRAFERSRGRYVFLLNPDCEMKPRALTRLCNFLDENSQAAAAAPLLADEGGLSQREFQLRRLPGIWMLAAEALLLDKIFPGNRLSSRYRYRDLDLSSPQVIEQPAAAALLIRREVFSAIGELDEQFAPAWFEDVDFCRRLAAAGKDIYLVPDAVARHFGGASLEHLPYVQFIDLWYRNMWLYARKWFSKGEAEALRYAIVAGMLLRTIAAFLGVKNGSTTRGEALHAYTSVLRKAMNRWGAPSD